MVLFIVSSSFTQSKYPKVKLDVSSFDFPEDIPIGNFSAILDSTKEVFSKYVNYGSLKDSNGKINKKVLVKFKQLFDNNSKVVNDFLKRPGLLLNYDEYAELAETFLDYDGIKYDIKDAKITNVTQDDNYYRIDVRFKKLMYQGFKNDEPKIYSKPLEYDLTLSINMSKATMDFPKIYRIKGNNLLKAIPKKVSFTGLYGSYGFPNITYTNSQFLKENSDPGKILKGISTISFGFDYNRNFMGGSNIYWNIGTEFSILTMNLKSDNTITYSQVMNYDNIVEYERIIKIDSGVIDNTTINSINIPLGIFYRKDFGKLHTILGGINIAPSINFTTTHFFTGQFTREKYILENGTKTIPITGIYKNSNGICNGPDDLKGYSFKTSTKEYSLLTSFRLKYLYKYSYNQSFSINFTYGMYIKPIITNANEIFLGEDDIPKSYNKNSSFTQSIYKDIKPKYFSIGIGWYYNFESKGLFF